jgi:hypothetical protein
MVRVRRAIAERRAEEVTASQVAAGKKQAPKLRASSALTPAERMLLVAKLHAFRVRHTRENGYRPPAAADFVLEAERVGAVKMSERTARRWMASKRAIVDKARQSRRAAHSRASQRYTAECARRGVAPGWLAGVDGRTW